MTYNLVQFEIRFEANSTICTLLANIDKTNFEFEREHSNKMVVSSNTVVLNFFPPWTPK